jgi:multidrug efflux pump subunit AcrB
MDNSILTQIGFVVLIGLAAKKPILIVEFVRQAEEQGANRWDAAVQAGEHQRKDSENERDGGHENGPQPWAGGAGSELRRAFGTAVFFGMLGVTFFGLLFTPVFFALTLASKPNASGRIKQSFAPPRSCLDCSQS